MQSTVSTWRAGADPDDLREYDRFGPWIDSVTGPGDLPRRFRPWWPELSGARHLLKVPRPYDRSEIRPGMDLYESVIAVFPDAVTVLRAEATEVRRQLVLLTDVVATVRHTNLLVGRWSLLLADGSSLDVGFSSVSQETIAEVDASVLQREPLDDQAREFLPALDPTTTCSVRCWAASTRSATSRCSRSTSRSQGGPA